MVRGGAALRDGQNGKPTVEVSTALPMDNSKKLWA